MYECVAQTVVGMVREVNDSEHEVFVFKRVIFLLATLEKGKIGNVILFTHAGGAAVLTSLMDIICKQGNFLCNAVVKMKNMDHGSPIDCYFD